MGNERERRIAVICSTEQRADYYRDRLITKMDPTRKVMVLSHGQIAWDGVRVFFIVRWRDFVDLRFDDYCFGDPDVKEDIIFLAEWRADGREIEFDEIGNGSDAT